MVDRGDTRKSHGGVRSLRTAIATVSISGTVEGKLPAASAAGSTASRCSNPIHRLPFTPAAVRSRCVDLGLTIRHSKLHRTQLRRDPPPGKV